MINPVLQRGDLKCPKTKRGAPPPSHDGKVYFKMLWNRSFNLIVIIFLGGSIYSQQKTFSKESLIAAENDLLVFNASNQNHLSTGDTLENEALQKSNGGGGKLHYVLFSLLIPGSGQWAMGRPNAAKVYLGADVALWLGYIGMNRYTATLQRDLETYAALHAGVNTANKDDQYWIDVGSASSIYQFNADKLRERDLEALYPEGTHYDWVWDEEKNRVDYVEKRFDRLDWKRYTNWMIGALVLNRIISAVDVVRLIQKDKNSEKDARQSYLQVKYGYNRSEGDVFKLNLTMEF